MEKYPEFREAYCLSEVVSFTYALTEDEKSALRCILISYLLQSYKGVSDEEKILEEIKHSVAGEYLGRAVSLIPENAVGKFDWLFDTAELIYNISITSAGIEAFYVDSKKSHEIDLGLISLEKTI